MTYFATLAEGHPVAYTLLVLAGAIIVGLSLGAVRVRGLGLDIAGVLFGGILFGHFGASLHASVLAFVREFGLVLFVFAIGMQVGPGFINSLRSHGLWLNVLAASTVVLGAVVALALGVLCELDPAAVVGIFAGATTNTPALGAAQEALKSVPGLSAERLSAPAVGYAAAYPLGVVGIIATMLLTRLWFRIRLQDELRDFERLQARAEEVVQRMSLVVSNPNLEGLRISQLPASTELGIVVSRTKAAATGEVHVAKKETILHEGDTLLAVGPAGSLERFRMIVGKRSDEDLTAASGNIRSERATVTHKDVLGKRLAELALPARFGVAVSRVRRAGVDLTALPGIRLQFGDVLQLVGDTEGLKQARELIGDSVHDMSSTNFLPIFVGVALGVVVGTLPLSVPFVPVPVRLGLAGGPLVVSIFLSRLGKLGPLVWYVPASANAALRGLGIVLFLACVGLKAGEHFVQMLLDGPGLIFMAVGVAVTIVPLLLVGLVARFVKRINFLNILGLFAGSMTDPPALAFANNISGTDVPAVAYASVYPLTMLLRIIVAQLLVLFFVH